MATESTAANTELVKTREVIESYIFSTSRRNLSIYSERLLMRIVEVAQRQVAGLDFREGNDIGQVSIGPLGEASLDIPIRGLLGPGNTNYKQAKEAIMELMQSPYMVERPKVNKDGGLVYDEKGVQQFEFIAHQLLNDCEVNVKPGIAHIIVNGKTWNAVLDFSKGFRKFDLNAALMLSKSCSARMFRLVSNQKNPLTFSIDTLKKMWGLEDKYPKTSDFIKRTIVEAKAELDTKAPWTFEYVLNYNAEDEANKGRRGKKAITSVTFFPVRRIANMSLGGTLNVLNSPRTALGDELYNLLLSRFGFEASGIRNNQVLFVTAKDAGMDVLSFLDDLSERAANATNPAGYVIRALERCLSEKYGVRKTSTGYVISTPMKTDSHE